MVGRACQGSVCTFLWPHSHTPSHPEVGVFSLRALQGEIFQLSNPGAQAGREPSGLCPGGLNGLVEGKPSA